VIVALCPLFFKKKNCWQNRRSPIHFMWKMVLVLYQLPQRLMMTLGVVGQVLMLENDYA